MNYNNLFLLGSGPLQLVNALEAVDHFLDEGEAPGLILSNRKRRHPEGHQKLVELKKWSEIHWTEPTSVMGMMRPPKRMFALKQHTRRMHELLEPYRGCERLFFAQYTEFNRHLCFWLKPRNIIYLTDGIAIGALSKKRQQALISGGHPSLKERLRLGFYGWHAGHPDSMTFFSALCPTLSEKDSFVRNTYSFVSRNFGEKRQLRVAVACIGQPHYPNSLHNGFCFPDYWKRMEQLGVTEYWAHPKECPDYVAERCESLGIEVKSSPYPIEIAFLEIGCPSVLVSVCSTALYTCKTVFENLGVEAYYIETQEELERTWADYRVFLKSAGIEAFPLATV